LEFVVAARGREEMSGMGNGSGHASVFVREAGVAMSEAARRALYGEILEEITSLVAGETYEPARYASAACLLAKAFAPRFFWTGFYVVDPLKPGELVVGPYQGTLGCLRIPFEKGVCGACATRKETIIVPDVHAFPGHIACDSRSNSEIVVPVFRADGTLAAVLDVDSEQHDAFDTVDAQGLEAICAVLLRG
jgi:GAF domain-containing protein